MKAAWGALRKSVGDESVLGGFSCGGERARRGFDWDAGDEGVGLLEFPTNGLS